MHHVIELWSHTHTQIHTKMITHTHRFLNSCFWILSPRIARFADDEILKADASTFIFSVKLWNIWFLFVYILFTAPSILMKTESKVNNSTPSSDSVYHFGTYGPEGVKKHGHSACMRTLCTSTANTHTYIMKKHTTRHAHIKMHSDVQRQVSQHTHRHTHTHTVWCVCAGQIIPRQCYHH